ncbi:21769_t:CDS:2 [Cetraspora pellucida]|uniref:MICOS complex subunit MIC10 n=1 Tax=Cetraspora pellucida TaxID=1433469 RepID=A0A9N9F4E2_9GLOM|nr:21769_t:CDS:2 [Cetraspora pellucida]
MSVDKKPPSEDILNEKAIINFYHKKNWITRLIILCIGLSVGIVASALIFKRKSWPIAISTGFGIGVSYAECQKTFNPTAIPGAKIIKNSSNTSE